MPALIAIALGASLVIGGLLFANWLARHQDVARPFAYWHEDIFPVLLWRGEATRETGGGAGRANAGRLVTHKTDAIARHGERPTA